jgi:glycosyltransferase involved in cell wall biosynthesis
LSHQPKLLILCDWFAPGYKAGGPIRSCVNVAYAMRHDFDVWVITTDRDINETQAYPDVKVNEWLDFDTNIKVKYLSPDRLAYRNIKAELTAIAADTIYLNSMYSQPFTVFPLLLAKQNLLNSKIVLAPRGMLKDSALQYKALKKKVFLKGLKFLGAYRNIYFHATNAEEKNDIQLHTGAKTSRISTVSNFPCLVADTFQRIEKQENEVKFIFLSRILPIKNLLFILNILEKTTAKVTLTIYGTAEDTAYLSHCQTTATALPSNIKVAFMGEITPLEVPKALQQSHFFVLPTLGENFGHAIFEAFAQARPVLISDQTPWRDLQTQQIGFDIPLNKPEKWLDAIHYIAAMTATEYTEWTTKTHQFAHDFIQKSDLKAHYIALF